MNNTLGILAAIAVAYILTQRRAYGEANARMIQDYFTPQSAVPVDNIGTPGLDTRAELISGIEFQSADNPAVKYFDLEGNPAVTGDWNPFFV